MSGMPTLALPEAPNFMVVNGQTFLVDKVDRSPSDLMKSVTAYYEGNLAALKQQVAAHVGQEGVEDLNRQVTRIEQHLKSGVISLAENLRLPNKVLMHKNNRVYEARIIPYRPNRMSGNLGSFQAIKGWIERDISKRDAERYTSFLNWLNPLLEHFILLKRDLYGVKADLYFTQDLVIGAHVCCFNEQDKAIYVTPHYNHPHVHGDGHLCTGGTDSKTFWEDPQFALNFNMINPYSPANSSAEAYTRHKEFLKNAYFTEGRVREQEVSAWRV